jgi:hypothetical protein
MGVPPLSMSYTTGGKTSRFSVGSRLWQLSEEGNGYSSCLNIVVVHALKPIKKGQELLTTYTDTKRPRSERRAHLSEKYNFFCECSVCSLPSNESIASDERLTQMQTLKEKLSTWNTGAIGGKEVTRLANEIWEVGEIERYWSEYVSARPIRSRC